MQIIFDRWDAGFHGINPGSVPVRSMKQAIQFLTVLAAATGVNQVIHAKVEIVPGWFRYFRIEDEDLHEGNRDYGLDDDACLNHPRDYGQKGQGRRPA